jgi:uncharacterized protein
MPRMGSERAGGKGREMVAGSGASEPLELGLLLVAVGALPGFLAGVPLEVRMPPRIGTFLAIIIPTSISSYRAHDAPAAGSHFALA